MDVSKRSELDKKLRLCFCCLGEGHSGQYCTPTKVCGLNSCKELHHRLLHSDQPYLPHGGDKTTTQGASLKCGQPPLPVMKKQESDESIVKAQGGGQRK